MNKTTNAAVVSDVEDEKPHLTLVDPASEEAASEAGGSEEAGADPDSGPKDRAIRFDSLGIAMLDHHSLLRVFRDQLRMRIGFLQSELGGGLSLEEAIEAAVKKVDDEKATELFERLLTTHTDTITFPELLKLWQHSPHKAELIWLQMKEEAHADFMSGHLASMVFRPAGWMRCAWERAKFLAVRDSFIEEYTPEGGVEVALVDTMAQSHFLQLHWTEVAVTRTNASPKRISDEYQQWLNYRRESGRDSIWYPGEWDLLYATEVECQEQAIRMADHFARLFQRAVKALDNHRLAKARFKRLSAKYSAKYS